MIKWNKNIIIKEIDSQSNINTYLTRIEPICKEITPKDKDEYYKIIEKLEKFKEQMKDQLNIFSITEEKEKLYIFIDNNEEILSKIDKLILSDELYTQKEGIIQDMEIQLKKMNY